MIGVKRPSKGLSASRIDDVIGKKVVRDIKVDEFIFMDMLEG